jgi:hypothetical protein
MGSYALCLTRDPGCGFQGSGIDLAIETGVAFKAGEEKL